ncbi:hypothetical protein SAMD00019534_106030 [Acytostelium subglobosum LB1]|uniref:hypothetical protein n=1 Tax=Acytostelium subglobosum LB1 TaxID=1410327 RepID=UPI0006447BE0|nr:hypothetical protein SAMD00019534_106030 [Acytostelium subglobosum LB1]GAM27427.1 hypothetical protein SAMD00019534_106030 [Acytostelium subglobosum LB1]|eukprot:XP_012749492.1 hypothetical protein SAMD00019534_106030 [Acytostelium subglobosum LB1]
MTDCCEVSVFNDDCGVYYGAGFQCQGFLKKSTTYPNTNVCQLCVTNPTFPPDPSPGLTGAVIGLEIVLPIVIFLIIVAIIIRIILGIRWRRAALLSAGVCISVETTHCAPPPCPPPMYVQPAPMYVQPAPMYVQPPPVQVCPMPSAPVTYQQTTYQFM